jgi:hypothetical protein
MGHIDWPSPSHTLKLSPPPKTAEESAFFGVLCNRGGRGPHQILLSQEGGVGAG